MWFIHNFWESFVTQIPVDNKVKHVVIQFVIPNKTRAEYEMPTESQLVGNVLETPLTRAK